MCWDEHRLVCTDSIDEAKLAVQAQSAKLRELADTAYQVLIF